MTHPGNDPPARGGRASLAMLVLAALLAALAMLHARPGDSWPAVRVEVASSGPLVLAQPGFVTLSLAHEVTARSMTGFCPRRLALELRDDDGALLRRMPDALALGCLGESRRDSLYLAQSALDAPLPAGAHRVSFSYRDPWRAGRQRDGDGVTDERQVPVARIEVLAVAATPDVDLEFRRGWAPPQPSERRPDGKRRTFERRADVLVESAEDLEVYLALEVLPTDGGGVQSPDPHPGAQMVVRRACPRDERVVLEGAGLHHVVIPIPGGTPCEVTVRSRYAIVGGERPVSGALEVIAWRRPTEGETPSS